MIESKELRIGNWVKSVFGETRVTAVSLIHDEVSVYDPDRPHDTDQSHDLPFNKIEPIPLTEEWLLRFGFDKDNNGNYWIDLMTHYLELMDSDGHWFPTYAHYGELSHVPEQRIPLNYIESIHHLQNLYFTLTAEELELKN